MPALLIDWSEAVESLPDADFRALWALREWPGRLAAATRETLDALDADRARMISALIEEIARLRGFSLIQLSKFSDK